MTAFPPLKWSETLRVNESQPAYRGAGRMKASALLWAFRETPSANGCYAATKPGQRVSLKGRTLTANLVNSRPGTCHPD